MFDLEERERALQLLLDAYLELKGSPFDDICNKFEITVRRRDIKKDVAYLSGFGPPWEVRISNKVNLDELLEFLVYHELAEGLLLLHLRMRAGRGEDYWEKECWCDGFATAMLLAKFGIIALTRDNYGSFLTTGVGIVNEGAVANALQASRLRSYHIDTGNKKIFPLLQLAEELTTS